MAFCSNCGREVEDGGSFCTSCGKAVPTHGANGSVVVIKRKKSVMGFAMPMTVWIDEKEAASSIKNGQEVQLTISDGEHIIRAGITEIEKGKAVSFVVASEKISFIAEIQMGLITGRFKLTQTGKQKL